MIAAEADLKLGRRMKRFLRGEGGHAVFEAELVWTVELLAANQEMSEIAGLDEPERLLTTPLAAVDTRWIELIEEELGALPREEKPWIRQLAADIVAFARHADRSADVLFAWSM